MSKVQGHRVTKCKKHIEGDRVHGRHEFILLSKCPPSSLLTSLREGWGWGGLMGNITILCSAVLIQYQRVTNRRTDRRADRKLVPMSCISMADACNNENLNY